MKSKHENFIFRQDMASHHWKRTVSEILIMRVCLRDESGVMEMKTIFWWNGRHGHRIDPRVISSFGDMWWDWYMSLLFLLVLLNSSGEWLLPWIMLPETYYSIFGKSLTTDLMCVVSKVVHILNTYEIGPRINLWCSTSKLFNFLDILCFRNRTKQM